ncbi:MAG: ABC transporter ATP-binding protein [Pirellulaceae bacterium]|nr:ABC transporter ATP-binding protein [Pirellulaceae bacterium]
MSQLVVTDLRKEFPTPNGPLLILDGVNFSLESGKNLAIVGPSGSGKSTLLQIIGALDTATSGSIQLAGIDPAGLNPQALSKFRNEQVGFVFQEHHLLPQLSALENVLLPRLATGTATDEDVTWGRELLNRVGLSDRSGHLPSELSGGEKQRVAVARSLISRPALLLADEPTGSLDQANAETIGKLLLDVQQVVGAILICVTHSSALASVFEQTARLNQGRLEFVA